VTHRHTHPHHGFSTSSARFSLGAIALGQLAIERAQDSAIREFAKRMVADFQQNNAELQQLAHSKGWRLPPNAGDWMRVKQLIGHTPAANFDRVYMHEVDVDHRNAQATLRNYVQTGTDPDLKQWATQTIPMFREHLQSATATGNRVGMKPTP
jgi:putative membrane protein